MLLVKNHVRYCASLLLTFGLTLHSTAYSASALPDVGTLPRLNTQPAPPIITSPALQDKAPDYPAGMQSSSNLAIQVARIQLTGNRQISERELQALLQPSLGRVMDMQALQQLSLQVTRAYRQRGYLLAEAYFPEQDIIDNTLHMVVLEGYLGQLNIKTQDAEQLSQLNLPFLAKIANHNLNQGDAINESNLVRNITVLNSLPSIRAASDLSPGDAVGFSDVSIELQALPFITGYAGANTYGNRFSGRETVFAGLFLNNLAGRGDRFSLNLRDSNGERQRSAQLAYSLPVHASGTLLNLSAGYSNYRLGGVFSSLGAMGRSWFAGAYLDQPVLRARQGNVTARAGVVHKMVSDDVSAFSLKNQRGINALELGLFGDWRDVHWGGFNQIGFNLKFGEVDFKNMIAQNLDDTGAKTDGSFVKYNVFASRVQALNAAYNLTLNAEYQGANQNLDPSEKLAIGGINRWREFGELPVSADRGLLFGAELRRVMTPIGNLASFLQETNVAKNVELSPYVFLDKSRGLVNHIALSNNNQVNSLHYGAGLDVKLAKNWLLDFTVSHQKSKIEGVQAESETRAWGQISTNF
jgi:hemolysin activation/secretion protein